MHTWLWLCWYKTVYTVCSQSFRASQLSPCCWGCWPDLLVMGPLAWSCKSELARWQQQTWNICFQSHIMKWTNWLWDWVQFPLAQGWGWRRQLHAELPEGLFLWRWGLCLVCVVPSKALLLVVWLTLSSVSAMRMLPSLWITKKESHVTVDENNVLFIKCSLAESSTLLDATV